MTPRRTFIKAMISSAIAASFLPNITNAATVNKVGLKTDPQIKPKRLKAGDTIGLITPVVTLGKMKKFILLQMS